MSRRSGSSVGMVPAVIDGSEQHRRMASTRVGPAVTGQTTDFPTHWLFVFRAGGTALQPVHCAVFNIQMMQ